VHVLLTSTRRSSDRDRPLVHTRSVRARYSASRGTALTPALEHLEDELERTEAIEVMNLELAVEEAPAARWACTRARKTAPRSALMGVA
jgi:hypothetical protein